MDVDELRSFLNQHQVRFEEQEIQHGTSFKCKSGEIFNFYPKRGKVVVQGRPTALAQAVRDWSDSGSAPATFQEEGPATRGGMHRDIFVIYGHDDEARQGLELLLHRMGLNPIVLANLTPDGDTIIEKLEKYLGQRSNVGFACALLTPDDEGYPQGRPEAKLYRARQNVVLELGMVLARLGRKRVAIIRKESVEQPSDIAGLIYMPFKERVDEVKTTLFRALQECGYTPNSSAL